MADAEVASVELAVIGFPGSEFKGEIVPALAELVNAGTVTILDLALISKTADGDLLVTEVSDTGSLFDDLDGEVMGLLSADDLELAAELLERGDSAAVIVWENSWARRLTTAIRNAGGELIAHDRLDAETVNAALAMMEGS